MRRRRPRKIRSLFKVRSSSTVEVRTNTRFCPKPTLFIKRSNNSCNFVGHINHSLFWKNLAPSSSGGGQLSDGPLKAALERDFGSVESFKKEANAKGGSVQGSGWVWLGYNKSNGKLEVVTTANQDPLLCTWSSLFITHLRADYSRNSPCTDHRY